MTISIHLSIILKISGIFNRSDDGANGSNWTYGTFYPSTAVAGKGHWAHSSRNFKLPPTTTKV
eukprot:scaffold142275_cov19-Prasinocladus_malaysianus.AAC.1